MANLTSYTDLLSKGGNNVGISIFKAFFRRGGGVGCQGSLSVGFMEVMEALGFCICHDFMGFCL
jgi:hypothetical protein